jgi:uncharacterized protein (DUF1810 family)
VYYLRYAQRAPVSQKPEALLIHEGKRDIDAIMGSSIDALKLQTCMNLFNRVSPNDIFEKVLDAFF